MLALRFPYLLKDGASIREDPLIAIALQIIDRFLFQLYKRPPNPEQKPIEHVEHLFYEDLLSDQAYKIEIAVEQISLADLYDL